MWIKLEQISSLVLGFEQPLISSLDLSKGDQLSCLRIKTKKIIIIIKSSKFGKYGIVTTRKATNALGSAP